MQNEKWSNIPKLIFKDKVHIRQMLINEKLIYRAEFFLIFVLFVVVSALMSVVNVFTHYQLLMYGTIGFAILNVINIILALIHPTTEKIAHIIFGIETCALFTYFAIIGQPEGFSVYWSLLIPTCGFLLFGRRYGTVICLAQFAIYIVLFQTSWGNSLLQFDYTSSFKSRFPIMYLSFMLTGIFFEAVRYFTNRELTNSEAKFHKASCHDFLTGLQNRQGFAEDAETVLPKLKEKGYAVAIMDLDHFKDVNDNYGHTFGDDVLKASAKTVEDIMLGHGSVSRWGGEEFAFIFNNTNEAYALCDAVLNSFRTSRYEIGKKKIKVTASIGLLFVEPNEEVTVTDVFAQADILLYKSKENGRNQITQGKFIQK